MSDKTYVLSLSADTFNAFKMDFDSSLQEGALTRRPTQKPPSEREVASHQRCRKE